ncbi:MAG: hypothetical protein ACETWE_09625 [Candidatus Bathyarchaeia archaeon]
MKMKKILAVGRRRLLALLYACLLAALVALSATQITAVAEEQYVFYGYAPTTKGTIGLTKPSVNATEFLAGGIRLHIIGISEGASVKVYDLTTDALLASTVIGGMEVYEVALANETFFKVVSDKMVSALLEGGAPRIWTSSHQHPAEGYSTFYPSIEGSFIGTEFVFLATKTFWVPMIYTYEEDLQCFYGLETSHVTVYDATGGTAAEFDVDARGYSRVKLKSGEVYRAVSTGNIMILATYEDAFTYLPSLTGGFAGKHFMASRPGSTWAGDKQTTLVVAQENSEVSAYDLTRPGWQIAMSGPDVRDSVAAGEIWFSTEIEANKPVGVESSANVAVLFGGGGWGWGTSYTEPFQQPQNMGEDISFLAVDAGEEISFYAPTAAIIFATDDSMVEVDGVAGTMEKDAYRILLEGLHKARADEPLVIEVLGDANTYSGVDVEHAYEDWGSYLIPVQSIGLTFPEPPPIGGMGELLTYIIGGVVAVVAVVVIVVVLRRRRRARPL